MTDTITRRAFVGRSARGALAAAALRFSRRHLGDRPAPTALRIGVLSSSEATDATSAMALGIKLGVDEATHAAALFGGSIELVPVTLASLREQHLSAVIGGDGLERCRALAAAADLAGTAYVNASCSSDSLRGNDCRATTFHVAPSDAMYRDALSQASAPAGARAVAWDPSLARFGADTLNERFRARFNTPMTAEAWLGWLAVKVLWESSLRARSTDAKMLMQYMARDGTQFDGHKGRPLSFRQWDHQLRQPIYIVGQDERGSTKVIAELPAAGPPEEASRDALDRLGTPASRSICRMSP
jgi:ABC-type branched-subunit amino acid transport system substrate-binding protein